MPDVKAEPVMDLGLGQWQEEKRVGVEAKGAHQVQSLRRCSGGLTTGCDGRSRWTWKSKVWFEQGCKDRDRRPMDTSKTKASLALSLPCHGSPWCSATPATM